MIINTVEAQLNGVAEFIHDVVPGEYDCNDLYECYASSTFAPPVGTSKKIFNFCMNKLQREGCTRNLLKVHYKKRPVVWSIR
ncbi:hypothetical protein [Escherichia coli]|uniref:hypothetical protein n=1 Tax=Escherichia coli TaxID=562 RepID=UPI000E211800|nr:hypothetical protein [Escherichia coli]